MRSICLEGPMLPPLSNPLQAAHCYREWTPYSIRTGGSGTVLLFDAKSTSLFSS